MPSPAIAPDQRFQRNAAVVATDMDGETVMMDIDKGVYFALNGTGSAVWAALERPDSFAGIVAQLHAAFSVQAVADLEADVAQFLHDMCDNGLIEAVD